MHKDGWQCGDYLMLRSPALSYSTTSCLQEWINNDLTKTALKLASCTLYSILEQNGFDSQHLSEKQRHSLWKYKNRMSYRPTPFGLFASFSAIGWEQGPVYYQSEFLIHFLQKGNKEQDVPKAKYRPNNTLYKVQDTYRFLRKLPSNTHKSSFEIATIQRTDHLNLILEHGKKAADIESYLQTISDRYSFSAEECKSYIWSLIVAQVLQEEIALSGSCFHSKKGGIPNSHVFNPSNVGDYVNMERNSLRGGIPAQYKKDLSKCLDALYKLVPYRENEDLKAFTSSFLEKFDQTCVPLLQALDPEIGIGYQHRTGTVQTSVLLKEIEAPCKLTENPLFNWTEVHQLLLRKWEQSKSLDCIHLSQEDLNELPEKDINRPNSTSMIFRIVGSRLFIKATGGTTGTALFGRFTPMNRQLYKQAKQLAHLEESANPHILFTELVHIGEDKMVNLELRASFYSYHTAILTTDHASKPLPLDDLYLYVDKGQLILWSKQYKKRVIPRLSSAYNYVRSDLSLYRFLCDLQQQGLNANYTFDLEHFFPGLDHYPRVVFEHMILYPATWVLHTEIIRNISSKDQPERVECLKRLAAKWHWPHYIALTEYDHQLVFDLQAEEDWLQFAYCFKNQDRLKIEEYLLDENNCLIQDEKGDPFNHEIICTLYHNDKVYSQTNAPAIYDQVPTKKKFVPGSEWLYYKLYIHNTRTNMLIKEYLAPVVRKLTRQGLVHDWFFVRYADPDFHIRVRFKVHPKQTGHILMQMERSLSSMAEAGIIHRYNLATYIREIDRYNPHLISYCEQHFCKSTALAVWWLCTIRKTDSDLEYYKPCFSGAMAIVRSFGFKEKEILLVFEQLYLHLDKRLDFKRTIRRTIQKNYRSQKMIIASFLESQERDKFFSDFVTSSEELSQKSIALNFEDRRRLCTDLIHMHLNRFLTTSSLVQEAIIYYAIWQFHRSKIAQKV